MSLQQRIAWARESADALLAEAARDEGRIFPRGHDYRSMLMVARHDLLGLVRSVEGLRAELRRQKEARP